MPFSFTIRHVVSDEQVRNMLVSALEGGSSYWIRDRKRDYGPYGYSEFQPGGKFYDKEYEDGLEYYLLPFVEKCALILYVDDPETGGTRTCKKRLDKPVMEQGLKTMQVKFPRHFNDFIHENDDADTADVFLQCCCFGDVLYG